MDADAAISYSITNKSNRKRGVGRRDRIGCEGIHNHGAWPGRLQNLQILQGIKLTGSIALISNRVIMSCIGELMSRLAISAAAALLAIVVFSGAVVWDGLTGGKGSATAASVSDGYYITEFRQASK